MQHSTTIIPLLLPCVATLKLVSTLEIFRVIYCLFNHKDDQCCGRDSTLYDLCWDCHWETIEGLVQRITRTGQQYYILTSRHTPMNTHSNVLFNLPLPQHSLLAGYVMYTNKIVMLALDM